MDKGADGRYVTWDLVRRQAIAYNRQGECLQCGRCCFGLIHIRGNRKGGKEPMAWVIQDAVSYEYPSSDSERAFFGIEEVEATGVACSSLDGRKCSLHDNGYSGICKAWPVSPDHQILWPDCGFAFVEVERWAWNDELVLVEDG